LRTYYGLKDNEPEIMRNKYGSNRLSEIKSETFREKYFKSFDDPLVTILLIALGVNVIFTFFGKVDWFECAGILISVLISTFISTLSEYKNEKNFKTLSDKATKTSVKVYRSGKLTEIDISEIVCEDYCLLQAGDMIPADGIITDGNISVDQSCLNGENKEVEKKPDNKQSYAVKNSIDFWDLQTLYRGCFVTRGECIMKVKAVGDRTVYGKLNAETEEIPRESPLTLKLNSLAKSISKFGYIGAIFTILIILFQKIIVDNSFDIIMINEYIKDYAQVISDFTEALIMGIIVIVVAVPEGLPLMIAIVCSLNMKKMMKSNVLVRKLNGIETAGSMNILFCDKTGTLTKGRLEVIKLIAGNLSEYNNINLLPEKLKKILSISITGNSSVHISSKKLIGGNTTEKALYNFLLNDKSITLPKLTKINENIFSSTAKYSAASVKGDFNGTLYKGAPEKILAKCNRYIDNDGNIHKITSHKALNEIIDKYAKNQMRIIALAYSEKYENVDNIAENLVLVGLAALKDEIRHNVKNSVESVLRAGIKVVMITGDKKETAYSIAKESGIISSPDDIILTSEELKKMSDSEIKEKLLRIKVISRALPDDKSRLVRLSQEMGYVTGMTGDGVNDCPALKKADVGFSMGSGTEAAKEAGDIIIMDDNFSSIKNAILYGRTIYKSIKKFIAYQLTINLAAVSVSVLGPLFGVYKPLNISQMLWINLLMDTLAAIAFGGEAALNKYLLEKPKKRDENIIDKSIWSRVLVCGGFIAVSSIAMFCSEHFHELFRESPTDIYFYSAYFSYFIFSSLFNAFNTRCDGIDLSDHLSCNKHFLLIISSIFIIQILMTCFGGSILRTAFLNFKEWLIVTAFAILIIPVDLLRKIIINNK